MLEKIYGVKCPYAGKVKNCDLNKIFTDIWPAVFQEALYKNK